MEVADLEAPSEAFDIDDSAAIGAVRRRLSVLAAAAGLDEARMGDAALIASELGSNVLKHARQGGAIVQLARDGAKRGVMIAAWDRGPGMNLAACMPDGMSTTGTRGVGLGAVARLASRFDAYTGPGQGTVITAAVFPQDSVATERFAIGSVCVPFPGESVSGDGWYVHQLGHRATALMCDGLGHGEGAATAAAAVIRAFRAAPDDPLPVILDRCDRAARSTRGAAATIARIDLARRELMVAGVGNVAVWSIGEVQKQLVTQHGTLGQTRPSQIREELHPFPPGAQLVMCSDGIKSRWHIADHPGLAACAPATIAAAIWRDHARGRDDASVVVVREAGR